jgi:hypothetical protein
MTTDPATYGRGKIADLRRAVHERLVAHRVLGALPTSVY